MYYPLVGITDRFILLACGVFRRDSRLANHRFSFRKLQIFISFRKLHQALLRSWLRLLLFIEQLKFPIFFSHQRQLWRIYLERGRFSR